MILDYLNSFMVVSNSIKCHNVVEIWKDTVDFSVKYLLIKMLRWILKKILWRWQSQSRWSSVVLMHSGFAYFCDESSGSWKILGKLREGQQTNVIYPGKDRNAWRNIARRFSACSLNFTFARKCGKVVRCSTNTGMRAKRSRMRRLRKLMKLTRPRSERTRILSNWMTKYSQYSRRIRKTKTHWMNVPNTKNFWIE